MAEILLVDDEAPLREGLALVLEGEGYAVRQAADGADAVAQCRARRPDLVLLDVMMPGRNGFATCAELRARDADLPIVFLTAKAGDADIVRGFGHGADDYIPKTASEQELLARVAAVLRRAARPAADAARFRFGAWEVDAATLEMAAPDGRREALNLREVELLRYFSLHAGEVVSRDCLVTRFWGLDYDGNESALSIALCRLRGKLGPSGACLKTVYGQGYRYVAP